ncbi:hypothetical protein [Marinobacter alexandrii]|jgi:hypothetical protein|uniref:hypothetical protein n=1 Tax=Marinobacter alexandrii TaxID=2570351 RepID=UPI002ABD622E|nr:hypothetical protein [Marinobacter alexandrii]
MLTTDYALSAGESKSLLTIAVVLNDGENLDQLKRELNRLDLRVDHESAYKESFRLDTREGQYPS